MRPVFAHCGIAVCTVDYKQPSQTCAQTGQRAADFNFQLSRRGFFHLTDIRGIGSTPAVSTHCAPIAPDFTHPHCPPPRPPAEASPPPPPIPPPPLLPGGTETGRAIGR